jgi:hypothetical protein
MNYKLRELHKNGYLVAVIERKIFKQLEHVFEWIKQGWLRKVLKVSQNTV